MGVAVAGEFMELTETSVTQTEPVHLGSLGRGLPVHFAFVHRSKGERCFSSPEASLCSNHGIILIFYCIV